MKEKLKKISTVCKTIFGYSMMLTLFVGALIFVGYLVALIIGGDIAALICDIIYKKVIPVIHEYGIPVFIDSDGDITSAVDWYAEVGADGMFPLERKAGVDVSIYLDKQPQMAFIGHFDKMCMKDGAEAMRREFERILPSMQRGKVIVSVDHQTPPDVSIENYREYVKLLYEYCGKATHEGADIISCPVFE